MIKYRLGYAKYGDAKYVSHLDLIRLFSRSFKRAGIPLTHSEGFNPHPKLAIALPLSVGITSECECMDAETDRQLSQADIQRLNQSLPMGLHINAMAERIPGMRKLSDIRWAEYRVSVTCPDISRDALEAFYDLAEIVIEKKTKRKTEEVDIKPDIHSFTVTDASDDGFMLSLMLSAGSEANLKPELVLSAMEKYIEGFSADDVEIHRVKILSSNGMPLL